MKVTKEIMDKVVAREQFRHVQEILIENPDQKIENFLQIMDAAFSKNQDVFELENLIEEMREEADAAFGMSYKEYKAIFADASKIHVAAEIIKTSALEFLAAKHGLTVDEVVFAMKSGNVRAMEQFKTLVLAGVEEAMQLAKSGKISLI